MCVCIGECKNCEERCRELGIVFILEKNILDKKLSSLRKTRGQ